MNKYEPQGNNIGKRVALKSGKVGSITQEAPYGEWLRVRWDGAPPYKMCTDEKVWDLIFIQPGERTMLMCTKAANETATQISLTQGLAIISHYQMDGSRFVEEMSQISKSSYEIILKSGEEIRLIQIDEKG